MLLAAAWALPVALRLRCSGYEKDWWDPWHRGRREQTCLQLQLLWVREALRCLVRI